MERPTDSIAPEAPQAEKRHATVLKCDIVGSTRINQGLDLDGQLEFKRGWEELVTAAAEHRGHVERFEGDGALVTFGSPDGSEDAAESAVRMALELVQAVRAARFVPGVQLQVRIGIATGVVAVLKRAHVAKSESVAGTTIDLAERLRVCAEPDQVVISEATRRLAGRYFHYEELGPIKLKGFDDGVLAWRVTGESAVVSRFQAQRLKSPLTPIIGRSEAMAALEEAWGAVLQGHGRGVCLSGDAGMGKSRLATAILQRAEREGALVLEIDCTPSTRNSPLYPLGVLLQRVAGIGASSSAAQRQEQARTLLARYLPAGEVPQALAYLAPLFGIEALALPGNSGPAEVRDRTIGTVVAMLRALARDGPLALLCEDLHWVDDTTAQVLQRVRQEIDGLRALLIVTTRPGSDAAMDLSGFTTIDLQPLPAPTAAEMVRALAEGAGLAEDAIHRIVERCEGVPLVLEEVTRNALEAASRTEAEASPAEAAGGAVPAALELVVQSRLARRPELAAVAQAAAVLGREFSIPLLRRMVPVDRRDAVEETVAVLARDGLLAPADSGASGRAQFKHAMICEAVYNTLLAGDRQRLHSHAANVLLQELKATPDAAPDVLAEHLRKAKRFVEAIQVRLAASAETVARGACVEAEGHCEAALAMVDEVADAAEQRMLRIQLLVQLGVALMGRYGYSSSKVESAYLRAEAACGESAEPDLLYPIIRVRTAFNLVRGNLATGYELSAKSMAIAEQSGRPEFRIDAMSVHCYATMYYRSLQECRSWISRCLDLYRQSDGERLTYPVPNDAGTAALAILPTIDWLLGDARGCEEAIEQGLAHVERLDSDFDRAYLHAWIGGVRTTQRRYAEALQHSAIAIDIAGRNGYREWHVTGLLIHLLAQAAMKPSPEALAQASHVCMALAAEGVGLNASWYLWGLARGYRMLGGENVAVAAHMLREAFSRAEASGETRMNPELLILQAELEPDAAAAMRLLTAALALADEQGAVANSLRAATALVLRSSPDEAALQIAKSCEDLLDGRAPYPAERGWMPERLGALRKALKSESTAAIGA